MTIGPMPMCMLCKHRRTGRPGLTCAAFPEGIPTAILDNEVDHRNAYTGDHGVRFEPIDANAAAKVKEFIDPLFIGSK